ncbi:MAG: LIC_10190 family membrane protein [Kaistella sp.]
MLYLFFLLFVLIPVFVGFGEIFQKFFGRIFLGIASKLIAGIFSVSVSYTLLSFFFPLNMAVEFSTLAVGISAFFYFQSYRECWTFFSKTKISFFVILLVTVFFGSYYPFILDHFGYYVPTVKWIAEVGLVRGISNLDLLLGQMSVWHILQAGFSNFSDPFLRINVVVTIAWLIYIYEKKVWIHLAFFPLVYLFIQSPSPDLPAIALSLIILNEILRSNKNSALLFTLSVFVFAIKPTIIWLPVFVALYHFFISKSNLKALIPGTVLLFLFLFKSFWTFGYPVFPVQIFDLDLSWKPNSDLLSNSSKMAIQKTFDMQFTPGEIETFSMFDHIRNWLFLEGIKGKIHLLFIFSLLAFLLYAVKQKSRIIWLLLAAIIFKSIIVLLFSAQYRFFIDVFFVIFFVLFYHDWTQNRSWVVFTVLSLSLGVFLSFPKVLQSAFPSFRLGNFMTGFTKDQLYKPAHFELRKFKTYQIGNLRFNVVQDYPFSFDTPLPAISPQFIQEDLDAGIFPQLKGKTLRDGFIWRYLTETEKIQVQKILDDWAVENHE